MQQTDMIRRMRQAAWLIAAIGFWLLWMAVAMFDPNWRSNSGIGPIIGYLPPLVRSVGSLASAALFFLMCRHMFRSGRSDNLEFGPDKIKISGFFGWRTLSWHDVERLGYRFEPVAVVVVHQRDRRGISRLLGPIATTPAPEKLTAAIEFAKKRFPKLLEQMPAAKFPTAGYLRSSLKDHLVSMAITLPLLVVTILLGHYSKNLQRDFIALSLSGITVYTAWIIMKALRGVRKTNNKLEYVVACLYVVLIAIFSYVTFEFWRDVDWPDLMALLLTKG